MSLLPDYSRQAERYDEMVLLGVVHRDEQALRRHGNRGGERAERQDQRPRQ